MNITKDPFNVALDSVLIVVPTYNEAVNIPTLLEKIFNISNQLNVLFVDDNSQDGTVDQIKKFQTHRPTQIHLLQRPGKLGLGTAYIKGFKWALEQTVPKKFQVMIEMDADLSHDPFFLKAIFEELKTHDAVLGSRYVPGGGTRNWGLIRKFISRFGSLYAQIILGLPLHDLTGGFNAWHRHVLERINLDDVRSEGYAFQIELKYRAFLQGFRFKEVPIIFSDRFLGTSKMSHRIVIEAMYRVWLLRGLKAQLKS